MVFVVYEKKVGYFYVYKILVGCRNYNRYVICYKVKGLGNWNLFF